MIPLTSILLFTCYFYAPPIFTSDVTHRHSKDEPKMGNQYFSLLSLKHRDEFGRVKS